MDASLSLCGSSTILIEFISRVGVGALRVKNQIPDFYQGTDQGLRTASGSDVPV